MLQECFYKSSTPTSDKTWMKPTKIHRNSPQTVTRAQDWIRDPDADNLIHYNTMLPERIFPKEKRTKIATFKQWGTLRGVESAGDIDVPHTFSLAMAHLCIYDFYTCTCLYVFTWPDIAITIDHSCHVMPMLTPAFSAQRLWWAQSGKKIIHSFFNNLSSSSCLGTWYSCCTMMNNLLHLSF